MTAPKRNPMSRAEVARLGGIARSADRRAMSLMGIRGAQANIEKNGADQPLRALAIARGHNIPSIAPSRRSSTAAGSRVSASVTGRSDVPAREPAAGRELDRDPAPIPPSGGGTVNPHSPRHLVNSAAGQEKGRTAANSPTNGYHGRF